MSAPEIARPRAPRHPHAPIHPFAKRTSLRVTTPC
jgi:hypothetical protein